MNRQQKENKNSDRLGRIRAMERCFDASTAAVAALEKAIADFEAALPSLQRLSAYQESDLWLKDFEADEKGTLPQDLKRGVLSEDGLFDLLVRANTLSARIGSGDWNAANENED